MPRYFFNLNDGRKVIPDLEGTDLPDDDAARAHAVRVVRELAKNRVRETRSWRLAVGDAQGTPCFELSFEDSTRLPPSIRLMFDEAGQMFDEAGRSTASLNEATEQVRRTLLSYTHAGEGREEGDLGAA